MARITIIAHLGPVATFSHEAAILYRDHLKDPSAQLKPCASLLATLQAVAKEEATCCLVPVENSTNGFVDLTLDSLVECDTQSKLLKVHDEVYLPVHHTLVVNRHSQPDHELKSLRKVYSHPQVFGQCKNFIRQQLPDAELLPVRSTAEAAKLISADDHDDVAAIAGSLVVEEYKCRALRKNIEDDPENRTRFLVFYNSDLEPSGRTIKSMLSFLVAEERPGALGDTLLVIKEAGVNLLSLTSRPAGSAKWQYRFFVELCGEASPRTTVWKMLEASTKELRWWGSWTMAKT